MPVKGLERQHRFIQVVLPQFSSPQFEAQCRKKRLLDHPPPGGNAFLTAYALIHARPIGLGRVIEADDTNKTRGYER
jgi:hypothetical protein